jgi:hypothetical protein
MAAVGLNMIGAFHTVIGSGPRIAAVSLADDFSNLQNAISDEFVEVTRELHAFVHRYSSAVLKSTGRVGMDGYGIELDMEIQQYYNLIQALKRNTLRFSQNKQIPTLHDSVYYQG